MQSFPTPTTNPVELFIRDASFAAFKSGRALRCAAKILERSSDDHAHLTPLIDFIERAADVIRDVHAEGVQDGKMPDAVRAMIADIEQSYPVNPLKRVGEAA